MVVGALGARMLTIYRTTSILFHPRTNTCLVPPSDPCLYSLAWKTFPYRMRSLEARLKSLRSNRRLDLGSWHGNDWNCTIGSWYLTSSRVYGVEYHEWMDEWRTTAWRMKCYQESTSLETIASFRTRWGDMPTNPDQRRSLIAQIAFQYVLQIYRNNLNWVALLVGSCI